jgi:hypothetical protein
MTGAWRAPADRDGWPFLPSLLFDMAVRFGLDVALRFAARHGGAYLYLPVRAEAEHALAREWGIEVLEWLLARDGHVPGSRIVVPKGPADDLEARRAAVRDLTARGLNSSEIARRLGVHVRTVHADRAAARDADDARQMRLFDLPGSRRGQRGAA